MGIKSTVSGFVDFCKRMLSESDGSPSSSRCLMFIFAFFSMWTIQRVVEHTFKLTDPTIVALYMSNIPMLITTLMGLIALPYGINKSTTTMSDIATMIANAKQGKLNMDVVGGVGKLAGLHLPDGLGGDKSDSDDNK